MSLLSPVPFPTSVADGPQRSRVQPGAVLALVLAGAAAFLADALSGRAGPALGGTALLALALAVTLRQARSAGVGQPERTGRRAAATATASSVFVAAFLSCVGPLERLRPEVTDSVVFASAVAVMSVVLLVVLPLSLLAFGWAVARDRRLERQVRALPSALVLLLAVTAASAAVADGRPELWLQAGAAVVAGVLLTVFSAGVADQGRARALRT